MLVYLIMISDARYHEPKKKVTQFVYFCILLYMFRVVSPPIIRSTKLYLQHLVFFRPLLLPAAIVEELEQV